MIGEGVPMRTFLIAATLLALAAPASAATRNFGITSFDRIRVDGPFKVSLTTGTAPFAKATGSAAALDRVSLEMRGTTLVVHNNVSDWSGYPGQDGGPIELSLGTHDLSSAWLNGSGSLAIDKVEGLSFDLSLQGSGAATIPSVDVDQLNANILGTSTAVLSGRAAKITALVRGISGLDAAALAAKDASIGVEGAVTVKAHVSNAVTVDGNGPVTVSFAGGPACTLRVRGSASVSGCKSAQ